MSRIAWITIGSCFALAACTDLPAADDPRDVLAGEPLACEDRLDNGDFDDGTTGWQADATDIIQDHTELPSDYVFRAHSGTRFAWLGGVDSATRRLSQRVNALPRGTASRLEGKYFVASASVARVEDTLTIDVVEPASDRVLATAFRVSNVEPTQPDSSPFAWDDFTVEISGEHTENSFVLRFTSVNDATNNTNFLFDTMTLVPSSCP